MWSHLLPLACSDVHNMHIAGGASEPYAYIYCGQSLTKVYKQGI